MKYNYTGDVKLDARIFLLYFFSINRRFFRKSPCILFPYFIPILYYFAVLYVSNFTINRKKMTLLYKNIVLSDRKTSFHWSSKIQMLQLWSKLPVKIKRSIFCRKWWCANIKFLKTIHGKKLTKFKICNYTSRTFHWPSLKVN